MPTAIRKSSDIETAREYLLWVADRLEDKAGEHAFANFIRVLVSQFMIRGNSGRKAPTTRGSLTPVLAPEICAFAAAHPEMNQDEIGRHFNVAGGRVSEALAGHVWSPGKQRK